MELVEPARCSIDVAAGVMTRGTGRYEKRLSDLTGLYADEAAFRALVAEQGDPIVYDVAEFRPSERPGDLIFGVTRMSPGRIGREFFLTRGHIHARADRPEIYYGQKGRGVMQMESPEGDTRFVEIDPQTVCYVPPFWIHRSVNIGDEDLVMMFSYPADAGQDYRVIAAAGGMRHRVVAAASGGWEAVPNLAYRPRTPESLRRLLGEAA